MPGRTDVPAMGERCQGVVGLLRLANPAARPAIGPVWFRYRCGAKGATRSLREWPAAKESEMPRMVRCVKLGQELEGLDKPPFKGDLGQRLYENVSKNAWRGWLEHSTRLINEYRLDLMSPMGQRVWMEQVEQYFFGEGACEPPDYAPPGAGT
jgi:Fe-S cluster biosynthesis and repair protein YggX